MRLKKVKIEDLLLHPVRMRILLTLAGCELTPKEISKQLADVAHATLYRHIAKLAEAGLLSVVGEAQKRGVMERTYALATTEGIDISASFQEAGAVEQFGFFLTFVTSILQDVGAHMKANEEKLSEQFGFQTRLVNLSDHEFKQVARKFDELLNPYVEKRSSANRTTYALSTIVTPRTPK